MEHNKVDLDEIEKNITSLYKGLPKLNDLVCDGEGDLCDSLCGGAGCGSCGASVACGDGARQLAETALNITKDTELILHEKETKANDYIRNVCC